MAMSIKTMMTNQRMEWYNIENPTIDLPFEFGEWDDRQQLPYVSNSYHMLPSMYGDVRDGLLVRLAVFSTLPYMTFQTKSLDPDTSRRSCLGTPTWWTGRIQGTDRGDPIFFLKCPCWDTIPGAWG